jgi:hypothetical protein
MVLAQTVCNPRLPAQFHEKLFSLLQRLRRNNTTSLPQYRYGFEELFRQQ